MSSLKTLKEIIVTCGPIPTVRMSVAKARGFAKQFKYFGATRYQLRLSVDGKLINMPLERARSEHRTERACSRRLQALSETERRIPLQTLGELDEADAEYVLIQIASHPDWFPKIAETISIMFYESI